MSLSAAGSTESFDYVIVGSGAAGSAAARVLADTGRSIAIVEEGSRVETDALSDRALPSLGTLYREMGLQQTRGRGPSLVLQGRCVGGSTVVNSAIARRMPEAVWQAWRTDHGLGDALPFADMQRNWQLIESELGAAPTPREVWGGNNGLMDGGRAALGIAGGPTVRFVRGCHGSARCQLGCPHGAKQSMLLTYIPYAEARGAVTFGDSRVERIEWRGDRAVGVTTRSSRLFARRAAVAQHHARIAVARGSCLSRPIGGSRVISWILDCPIRWRSRSSRRARVTQDVVWTAEEVERLGALGDRRWLERAPTTDVPIHRHRAWLARPG